MASYQQLFHDTMGRFRAVLAEMGVLTPEEQTTDVAAVEMERVVSIVLSLCEPFEQQVLSCDHAYLLGKLQWVPGAEEYAERLYQLEEEDRARCANFLRWLYKFSKEYTEG
jgi:hypothetical protein